MACKGGRLGTLTICPMIESICGNLIINFLKKKVTFLKYDLSKEPLCVRANFFLDFVCRRDKTEILSIA
jgi:hypothetical protein